MVIRKEYLSRLLAWKNEQVIKVVTGIRRCGKSTLLKQFQDRLLEDGVSQEQIISINFEDLDYEDLLDYKALYAYIKERLIARELVSEPIVTVEYVNMSVNVLGEVSSPGNVPITKDHFTVIDALAKSGDLTINGNRRAVMVSRNNNGVNEVHQIDLTDMQKTMLSDGYYLQQNDLVYVTPNDKRKRDSTNTGNIFHTPYIWMSIISMLASLIVIFK